MLHCLYIKNFALIDEISIDFQAGLNIVLGETGAGKSIVIDALMTTLGERTSPDFVKANESKSIVEATFFLENTDFINKILNDPDNFVDKSIILRREITSKGTSRCFLNDTPYPLSLIKEIGEYLVDFHGQHSHQQLLSPRYQIELLDSISNNSGLIEQYKTIRKQLENKIAELNQKEKEFDHLLKEKEKVDFDLQEIIRINPQPGELKHLENDLKKLENLEIINSALGEVYEILYKSENSATDAISLSIKKLSGLLKFYPHLDNSVKQLESALDTISEISKEIQDRIIDVDYEPDYLENLRIRLSELKYLEKKYLTFENIFSEKERLQKLILSSYSLEEEIQHTKNEILTYKDKLKTIAAEIHKNRQRGISLLEENIPSILEKLGMKNVTFKVQTTFEELEVCNLKEMCIELEGKCVKLLTNGIDKIEFHIATNPNTKPMPLDNIASGGELSRIMLALKSLTAEYHKFPTMIFDEIDVGISGKIASMTAQMMKRIASKHQIIAITHLPQIASAGNNTILIEKSESRGNTKISAKNLSDEDKIYEIAKLLSGELISDIAIENAKKLIKEINS